MSLPFGRIVRDCTSIILYRKTKKGLPETVTRICHCPHSSVNFQISCQCESQTDTLYYDMTGRQCRRLTQYHESMTFHLLCKNCCAKLSLFSLPCLSFIISVPGLFRPELSLCSLPCLSFLSVPGLFRPLINLTK